MHAVLAEVEAHQEGGRGFGDIGDPPFQIAARVPTPSNDGSPIARDIACWLKSPARQIKPVRDENVVNQSYSVRLSPDEGIAATRVRADCSNDD